MLARMHQADTEPPRQRRNERRSLHEIRPSTNNYKQFHSLKATVFDDVRKDGHTDVYECLVDLEGTVPQDVMLVKNSFTSDGYVGVLLK